VREQLAPRPGVAALLQDRGETQRLWLTLLADIAPAWLAAARTVAQQLASAGPTPPPPSVEAVASMIVGRMGWPRPAPVPPVTLRTLTVKFATTLQLAPIQQQRAVFHRAYVAEALQGPVAPVDLDWWWSVLGSAFRRMWRIRWENRNKEVFWRLAVDGIPLQGNAHVHRPAAPCSCGRYVGGDSPERTPRLHHFWYCPVALHVRTILRRLCPAPFLRMNLWLAVPPKGVEQCVWDVVALAALNAMESGRRYLRSPREGVPDVCARAIVQAEARFWSSLHDFAALGVPAHGWSRVSDAHPFLAVVGDRMVVADPPPPAEAV
jgi:hypothetical protein